MIYEDIKRGDVLIAELPYYPGSVQHGERPVIVIQNDIGNIHSKTLIVVPVTSKSKNKLPTHVFLEETCFSKNCMALCEQILTIDKSVIIRKEGYVSFDTMCKIEDAIIVSLAL